MGEVRKGRCWVRGGEVLRHAVCEKSTLVDAVDGLIVKRGRDRGWRWCEGGATISPGLRKVQVLGFKSVASRDLGRIYP